MGCNGSIEKPFATVPAAQKVVRDAIKNGGLESDAYPWVCHIVLIYILHSEVSFKSWQK